MINLSKIGFSGYKSFTGQTELDGVANVNLIIGKNNSGKSSVLDIVEYVFDKDLMPVSKPQYVILTQTLTEQAIERSFSKNTSGGRIGGNHYMYGSKFIGRDISYSFRRSRQSSYGTTHVDNKTELVEEIDENRAEREFEGAVYSLYSSLPSGCIRKISAERNVVPEEQNGCEVLPDGTGATSLISTYINDSKKDEALVESELLSVFNYILGEDAHFDTIRVQQVEQPNKTYLWEIFLAENGERYPLSKMGSGLKTILLVLINLLICPKEKEAKVFLFEELENNLHPAQQRRLFNYIYDYAQKKELIVFLTSHSHVSINCYFNKDFASIYHVEKINGRSTIKKIANHIDKCAILDDLDVRASDLLQSNGIIWVEGPSDRVYIKRWLNLVASDLKENEHYQFVYYGGKLLSHYTADMDANELINVLLTNRNSAIVIDSDKRNKQASINDTKKRVQEEFLKNGLFCWITNGKEIENYLSERAINEKYGSGLSRVEQYELFPNYIESVVPTFADQKVKFATELVEYIKDEDLQVLDLKARIGELARTIRKWNHLS